MNGASCTPSHAQSNGKAEAAVKNIKKLVKKCGSLNDEFWKGLLAIRNTPAELMVVSKVQDSLHRFLSSNSQFLDKTMKEKILDAKQKGKSYYNLHTTELPPMTIGYRVAIHSRVNTDWSLRGTIMEIGENHTYSVLTDQRSTLIHNRKYLCPVPSRQECLTPTEATSQLENPEPPPQVNTCSWRRGHGALRDPYPQRKQNTRLKSHSLHKELYKQLID